MKNNSSHAPDTIFEWISQKSFGQLSENERSAVLLHFTEEDYDDMHTATSAINSARTGSRKDVLMSSFARRHRFTGFKLGLIRAAAVLLPAVSAALCVWMLKSPATESRSFAIDRDTVYVTREIASAPAYIHDTVFLEKSASGKSSGSIPRPAQEKVHTQAEGIDVLTIDDLNDPSNSVKHNSLRDDSLVRTFTFISL